MSDVRVSEPHGTTAAAAASKISSLEEMMSKYGVKAIWNGTNAELKGTGVSGSINVNDTHCNVHVKLGMLARRIVDAGRLEASIRKRLKAAFEA